MYATEETPLPHLTLLKSDDNASSLLCKGVLYPEAQLETHDCVIRTLCLLRLLARHNLNSIRERN